MFQGLLPLMRYALEITVSEWLDGAFDARLRRNMTLEAALRALAPLARPHGFDTEALSQVLPAGTSSTKLARVLAEAMIAGRLTASVWREATSSGAPADFIAAMGPLWDALVRAGLTPQIDGFPEQWTQETLRLWGYTESWLITSEDEDLALMVAEFVPGLLELAADGACPKREFALGLVYCWARTTAKSAAGRETFAEVVTGMAQYASLARAANDVKLANYLVRLGSYATLGKVDRDAAYQRGLDLAGWPAPEANDVKVEPDCGSWRIEVCRRTHIRIRQTDGRIF